MESDNKQTTEAAAPTPTPAEAPKKWSNPTAAGLVALAVACGCFFGMLNGFVSAKALPLMGCWLLGGFVIQVIVGIMDLRDGNHTGGNTFLFFSAFFMLVGGLEAFMKYKGIESGVPLDTRIDGYAWAILTLVMWMWTPAFFTKFNLLSVIVILLDIALPFIALNDFQIPGFPSFFVKISAYALLLAGLVAVYLSAATVVNNAFKKKVLPLP